MNNKNHNAKIILSGIIVLVVFGVFFWIQLMPKLSSNKMIKEIFWTSKLINNPVYDVLILGDSRVYRGLNPSVIETQLDNQYQCFNYGFSSVGLDSFYLNNAIKKLNPNGKKTLLIGVSVNSFYPQALKNEHLRELSSESPKNMWVKKHIYPYLTDFSAYSFSDFLGFKTGKQYFETFNINSGFVWSCNFPIDTNSAVYTYQNYFKAHQIDTFAVKNFVQQLQILKNQQFKIVLMRIPASYSMFQIEDKASGFLINQLKQQAQNLGIHWIESTPSSFTYDGSHLIDKATNKLSQDVGIQLKTILNQP
ncbi:MAG: hypothetical protein Q8K70_08305 [Bacteroidota bacterium]|nr:hypothetical protein [Bacteroidota bacterium]